jgi:hypothetical protein
MLLKNVVKIRVFFFKRVNCDCDVMVFDVSMAIVRDGPHGFFYVSMTLSGEGLNSGHGNDFCRVTVFDIAKNCVQMWPQLLYCCGFGNICGPGCGCRPLFKTLSKVTMIGFVLTVQNAAKGSRM